MTKGLLLAVFLAAVAFPAAAAETPAQYSLTVKPEQVDIIGRALRHSPDSYERVQDLIEQLTGQVLTQQKAEADKTAQPAEEPKAE